MGEFERKAMKVILMYVLDVKKFEFTVDDNNEISFVLGNQELTTINKTPEEVQEILHQVIRW